MRIILARSIESTRDGSRKGPDRPNLRRETTYVVDEADASALRLFGGEGDLQKGSMTFGVPVMLILCGASDGAAT